MRASHVLRIDPMVFLGDDNDKSILARFAAARVVNQDQHDAHERAAAQMKKR